MPDVFENSVAEALKVLRRGGLILYPTDTVWGLGCDALNEEAVGKVYRVKEREDSKSLIILVAEERDILQYVAAPAPGVFDFLEEQVRPTTVIFPNAINLPSNLVSEDGSIAIRLVKDDYCRHLIKRLQGPIVSTSANISGSPTPRFFDEVSEDIRERVDYISEWRRDDRQAAQPSRIIRWNMDGDYTVIRD